MNIQVLSCIQNHPSGNYYNADSAVNGDACCDNLLCKLCGNGSFASSHKADKAKPRRALRQSIENVLEHAKGGMSKTTFFWVCQFVFIW